MLPDPSRSPEPFSIRDVFADAWGSYQRTFKAHSGWNVGFVVLAILVMCVTSCALVPVMALSGIPEDGASGAVSIVLLAVYGLVLVAFLVLFALHQGVTLAITRAEQRNETVVLGTCVGDAGGRLSATSLVVLARFVIDMMGTVPVFAGVVVAMMAMQAPSDPLALARAPGLLWTALIGSYATVLAWMLVVRAFLGLATPCAQYEEIGAGTALRRSVQLLARRRLQLVGMRVVWFLVGGVVYVLGYAPLFAALTVLPQQSAWALLALPFALFTYFVALHLLSFDTVLDGAFYARVTRVRTVEELAQVFR